MVGVLFMKKTVLLVLVLSLAASFSFAKKPGPSSEPDGLDELTKEKGLFKTTLINPSADFSSYNKLSPKRVLLQFRGRGPAQDESTAGSLVRKKSKGPAIPQGEELETFRQVISDAFVGVIGDCEEFDVVQESGSETLYVRVMVTNIVTDIASKSSKSDKDAKPFSAQGTITIDLIDAKTGVIQARFGEHSKSKKSNDSMTIPEAGAQWTNIWAWAELAATDLRQELTRVLSEDRG
jgi:hypothetical protein